MKAAAIAFEFGLSDSLRDTPPYKEVLGVTLSWLDGVVRAKRPAHVPAVSTRKEVCTLCSLTK